MSKLKQTLKQEPGRDMSKLNQTLTLTRTGYVQTEPNPKHTETSKMQTEMSPQMIHSHSLLFLSRWLIGH